jgi:hypothetical protein
MAMLMLMVLVEGRVAGRRIAVIVVLEADSNSVIHRLGANRNPAQIRVDLDSGMGVTSATRRTSDLGRTR